MSAMPVAIIRTGLVSSVGLSAPAACAAIRAKISNPCETRFIDSAGEWITAHQVLLDQPLRGLSKLAKMAAIAINDCLVDIPQKQWSAIPLLLCVAEPDRPGRMQGIDDELFTAIRSELGEADFSADSAVVPHGRVSIAVALQIARTLIQDRDHSHVVIAASDSLLTWTTLMHYELAGRLLTKNNSNGFIPGEGAGALLVGTPTGKPELVCSGIGFATEKAAIDSEDPLRAEGLTSAIKFALTEAGVQMHEMDYRITDISGEQYYFKEAALALGRLLRKHKTTFEIWHPAESIGDQGATAGITILALAYAACHKRYNRGRRILAHMANDAGQRAAMALEFTGTQ